MKGSKGVKGMNALTGKNANSAFGTSVTEGHSPDPPEATPSGKAALKISDCEIEGYAYRRYR